MTTQAEHASEVKLIRLLADARSAMSTWETATRFPWVSNFHIEELHHITEDALGAVAGFEQALRRHRRIWGNTYPIPDGRG